MADSTNERKDGMSVWLADYTLWPSKQCATEGGPVFRTEADARAWCRRMAVGAARDSVERAKANKHVADGELLVAKAALAAIEAVAEAEAAKESTCSV